MRVGDRLREWFLGSEVRAVAEEPPVMRKTQGLPSVLTPWRPGAAVNALPKPTAANLRRFAELPYVRRAMNIVKDRVASMEWQVQLRQDVVPTEETTELLRVLRRSLESPNPVDSLRTVLEQVLEDVLVGGFGAAEIEPTGDPARPVRLWPVDGATIQMQQGWTGDANAPRYLQQTGRIGADALQPLLDRELMYVRLNARTHTPFGLGRVEVAFDTIHQFLQANRYAGKLASNAVVQYALWLDEATPVEHERLIRWWQDEVEGTGQVPILSSETKPEVLRFAGGTDSDLRLQWQEFLVRTIANAFDLPPMFLGLSGDVNKSTAAEMSEQAFQTAVLPVANLIAEHMTKDVFEKALGLEDVEFVFGAKARDEANEINVQVELLKAGVLTVDEVRKLRGYGPMASALAEADLAGAASSPTKQQVGTSAIRNVGESV